MPIIGYVLACLLASFLSSPVWPGNFHRLSAYIIHNPYVALSVWAPEIMHHTFKCRVQIFHCFLCPDFCWWIGSGVVQHFKLIYSCDSQWIQWYQSLPGCGFYYTNHFRIKIEFNGFVYRPKKMQIDSSKKKKLNFKLLSELASYESQMLFILLDFMHSLCTKLGYGL